MAPSPRPVTGDHALSGDWRQTSRPTPAVPTTTPPLPLPLRPTTVSPTPTGRALAALLQTSIQGLDRLTTHPMSEPVPIDEDSGVVPIALLLYRGPDALARAREVRDDIRRQAAPPTDDQLAELFDLIDLAVTE